MSFARYFPYDQQDITAAPISIIYTLILCDTKGKFVIIIDLHYLLRMSLHFSFKKLLFPFRD